MMELVVAVAIGVLSVVFIGSLAALILLCRQRYCGAPDVDRKPILKYSRDLIDSLGVTTAGGSDTDLDDVLQLSPNIAKVLKDNDWVHDASGPIEQCLAILRGCHQISDQLSALSFAPAHSKQELLDDVREATRRVMPLVDSLVRCMYAGSRQGAHSALLEARAAALATAVWCLTVCFRAAYPKAATADAAVVQRTLHSIDSHLETLRLLAEQDESAQRESVQLLFEGPPSPTDAPSSTA